MPKFLYCLGLFYLPYVTNATPTYQYPETLQNLQTLTLPQVNSSGTSLPLANTTLQYVTLGHGIQNYSCSSLNATPVAIGALATLYDVSSYSEEDITAMPPIAVYLPLPVAPSTPLSVTTPLHIVAGSASTLLVRGYHYFGADGTPTFNLSNSYDEQILYAKKQASVKAPTNANPGKNGMGAVDWLYLDNKGGSIGLSSVYRVITAGGMPMASCEGVEAGSVTTIAYAALYWLYH